jgi:serine/threonine-protein kinase
MCNAVLRDEPPPLAERCPGAPDGLEDVVLKCVAKNAGERYHDVGELAAALEPFASEEGAALAQRIAKSVRDGPTSSQRNVVLSQQGATEQVARPESLPRLGLASPGGEVESWKDLMQATPLAPTPRSGLAVGAALFVLALVLLGIAFAT